MTPVFLFHKHMLWIRRLKEVDLQDSYYAIMNKLSNEDIRLIHSLSSEELHSHLDNIHKIFVLEDVNSNQILGAGTIVIQNDLGSQLCKIGNIRHITLDLSFQNTELYSIVLNHFTTYCRIQEKCAKICVHGKNS